MSEKHKCSNQVYHAKGSFRGHPCSNPGKVEREGDWYCGTHDPVRVEEKRQKRERQWSDDNQARDERIRADEIRQAEIERKAENHDSLHSALKALITAYENDAGDNSPALAQAKAAIKETE